MYSQALNRDCLLNREVSLLTGRNFLLNWEKKSLVDVSILKLTFMLSFRTQ